MTGVGGTPRDLGEYIRETRRRLVALERRQMPSLGEAMPGGYFYGQSKVGYLDGWYRHGGPARVRIGSLDAPLSAPLNWRTPYEPNKGRVVSLVWNGAAWDITGQPEIAADGSGFYSISDTLTGSWGTYNEWTLARHWRELIGATRLPTGLVVLQGLLYKPGTTAADEVIAVLPPACRPERMLIHTVSQGDISRAITIYPNGNICARANWGTSQYLNFDGVVFWAADSEATGNWINVGDSGSSFAANFTDWDVAVWGRTRFYKDRYGWVWFDGMVKQVNVVTVDNTNIVALPAAYRSAKELHLTGAAMETYQGFGARPADGLNWKGGSPSGAGNWISVAGVALLTTEVDAKSDWYTTRVYVNGWNQHGALYPDLSWTRRPDGLAQFRGLLGGGGTGSALTNIAGYPELYPRPRRVIMPTISNQARARLDIHGDMEADDGFIARDITPGSGVSTNWCSFDDVRYVP